jgi:hypothetical protein
MDGDGQGKVIVVMTVDWEGRSLDEFNLQAMEQFRNDYPDIGVLQFLNAAYFYKPDANPNLVIQAINRGLRPNDEIGLHIHGWKRLIEAAGIRHRVGPTWRYDLAEPLSCEYDCGHQVPISAYEVDELVRIINFSNETLERNGFGHPVSFRSGGWMSQSNVIDALILSGMKLDSSAVPTVHLDKDNFRGLHLFGWLVPMWEGITSTSQPYVMGPAGRQLWQVPNNGCLADYMTGDMMLEVFKENAAALRDNPGQNQFVVIGFHQESASSYIGNVRDAVEKIKQYAHENDIPFEFARMPLLGNYL